MSTWLVAQTCFVSGKPRQPQLPVVLAPSSSGFSTIFTCPSAVSGLWHLLLMLTSLQMAPSPLGGSSDGCMRNWLWRQLLSTAFHLQQEQENWHHVCFSGLALPLPAWAKSSNVLIQQEGLDRSACQGTCDSLCHLCSQSGDTQHTGVKGNRQHKSEPSVFSLCL